MKPFAFHYRIRISWRKDVVNHMLSTVTVVGFSFRRDHLGMVPSFEPEFNNMGIVVEYVRHYSKLGF
jgi:hypothetical protein